MDATHPPPGPRSKTATLVDAFPSSGLVLSWLVLLLASCLLACLSACDSPSPSPSLSFGAFGFPSRCSPARLRPERDETAWGSTPNNNNECRGCRLGGWSVGGRVILLINRLGSASKRGGSAPRVGCPKCPPYLLSLSLSLSLPSTVYLLHSMTRPSHRSGCSCSGASALFFPLLCSTRTEGRKGRSEDREVISGDGIFDFARHAVSPAPSIHPSIHPSILVKAAAASAAAAVAATTLSVSV
ncbi:hypothetical protein F4780DRAFT_286394 [Xylariomycetidae sp. FL0641]|nr:hypothetical protein F4780DRAFT_286394 [Xylariomycetidae sp. FL0641]